MKARDNPFRVERLHQLNFRFFDQSMAGLLAKLHSINDRGAIIGPHGTGKTTLLQELIPELQQQGYAISSIRFTEGNRSARGTELETWLARVLPENLLVLDGAEQLTSSEWNRIEEMSRSCRGLLITSHQPGLLPTIYETHANASLLCGLIEELTKDTEIRINELQIQQLFKRYRGNLRDCLLELYDRI